MLTAGGATYTCTNNGELHQKTAGTETTVYSYDVRGALVGVDLPNGIAIGYVVDADGRRIGKRVNGVLTKGWLYAGGLAPVAEVDALGQVTATFVYATKGNVPDVVLRDGTSYRLFTDHLGSVRLVVEATTGALVQQIDYDAFGRILYDSNPGFQPFGFAGGLYDPQTGLTRFGARDYDPEVGRWTSKDPIGFAGGSVGLFEYVGNNPVNLIDPSGLQERYSGMMREYVENPALASANTLGAGIATGVTALAAALPLAVEWAPMLGPAAQSCYLSPGCQQAVVGLLDPMPGGSASVVLASGPQVLANRAAGNAFRDEVAELLRAEGREVATEVYKRTPFGPRFIDIEVSESGTVLGGIETKAGDSPYTTAQRIKDWWLETFENYRVDLVRDH